MNSNVIPIKKTSPEPKSKSKRDTLDVDKQIGAQLRAVRLMRGWSMEKIAKAVGVTFQQFGKYEKGENRLSLSRAMQICTILGVDTGHFVTGRVCAIAEENSDFAAGFEMSKRLSIKGASQLIDVFATLEPSDRWLLLSFANRLAGKDL